MNREIEVHVDLDGQVHLAGQLWSRQNKGREGASFTYDPAWLASPLRFPLEPALSLDTWLAPYPPRPFGVWLTG